jgi:hypothetical protein
MVTSRGMSDRPLVAVRSNLLIEDIKINKNGYKVVAARTIIVP